LAEAHYNRAIVLKALNRFPEAVAGFGDAIRHDPRLANAYLGCAEALACLGKMEQALATVTKCSEHHPDNVDSLIFRAQLLRKLGRLSEGLGVLDLALRRRPDLATALNDRGNILKDMGRLTDALDSYRAAMTLRPEVHQFHSNLIVVAHYDARQTQDAIAGEYRDWNRRHVRPLVTPSRDWPIDPAADGKLRIGLVSGSLRRHPVGYFVLPVLEHRDRAAWHVTGFSNTDEEDDLTARIRHTCDAWVSIVGDPDHQAAERIRAARIDILLAADDCSSHGQGGRPLLFAHRPAPVQVAWAGLFDTTGIETMDYLLADAREVPIGAERWYSETVCRLPDGYVCYGPPPYAPPVGPLPWQSTGLVTFGCFNAVAKINNDTLALWARVLRQVMNARLILKNASFADPAVRDDYAHRLRALGIGANRFQLRGPSPHEQLLATYNEIDIALDSFPYSGGLTTCESLWMGVPVLTLPGPTFAGRHSASHLHNVGLMDWIAADPDDYVAKARGWTQLAAPLALLRAHLRDRMAASPLCDADRYCRNLEAAIAEIWRRSGPCRPAAPLPERMS
jgi:predicted O-linked N-acetylglucosamine transferase (SPINDLY family)